MVADMAYDLDPRSLGGQRGASSPLQGPGFSDVLAMMMKKPAPSAPVMNHFRPLTSQPPSTRLARVARAEGRACSGSGLGHRERGADLASGQRLEELGSLTIGCQVIEEMDIALIRGMDVQGRGPKRE